MTFTVKDIVKEWLTTNHWSGLCGDECGCDVDDLFPCEACPDECWPGYRRICTRCTEVYYTTGYADTECFECRDKG